MDEAALARANFDGFNPARFFEGNAEDEIPVDVTAVGGNFKR